MAVMRGKLRVLIKSVAAAAVILAITMQFVACTSLPDSTHTARRDGDASGRKVAGRDAALVSEVRAMLDRAIVNHELPYFGALLLPDGRKAMPRILPDAGETPYDTQENLKGAVNRDLSAIPYIWGLDGRTAGPTGDVRVIVAKVKFDDWVFPEVESTLLDDCFFNREPSVYPDSLAEYYERESYGKLNVTGVVLPASGSYAIPGAAFDFLFPPSFGDPTTYTALWNDFLSQIDADLDASQFDGNGDGALDAIIVVPPDGDPIGFGGPFAYVDNQAVAGFVDYSMDGVAVETYSVQMNCFGDEMNRHGVPRHEFGHVLGLPDIYDGETFMGGTPGPDGDEGQGAGGWAVMATSGYLDPDLPMCAPMKLLLGWDTPVDLPTGSGADMEVTLAPAEDAEGRVYRLKIGGGIGFVGETEVPYDEYFMFEERSRTPPGLPNFGMLVWRVNEGIYLTKVFGGAQQLPNCDEQLKYVDPVETPQNADANVDKPLAMDYSNAARGTDLWPYDTYDSITTELPTDAQYPYKFPVLRKNRITPPYFHDAETLYTIDTITRTAGESVTFHYTTGELPPPDIEITSFIPTLSLSGDGSTRKLMLNATVEGTSSVTAMEVRMSYVDAGGAPQSQVFDATSGSIAPVDLVPILPNQRISLAAVATDWITESAPVTRELDAVTLVADFDGNDVVDAADLAALTAGFGLAAADADYRLWLDPDGNGVVDERDAAFVGYWYGQARG
jgi:M6 family metalloprotease-like protein